MSTTSYTDTNNVVYTYTVPGSGNTGTAFVDLSPDAIGNITFLSTFIVDSITYTVTSIIADAFNNGSLTSVTIPSTITNIGIRAFEFNGITTATLYDGLLTIGARAFYGNQLTTIIIPNTVTSIGDSAFQSNTLTSITIGTSVTSIGASAFQSNSLEILFIPVSVLSIGNNSFKSNKLKSVYFFNIPVFGSGATIGLNSNAFSTNTGGAIIAYFIDTSSQTKINSLPITFSSSNKISMSKINLLKFQIQQNVSVEYLLADNFTLAEMIAAEGPAVWLLTYYSLQTLVDANYPLFRFYVSSTITLLSLFQCGISIANLKNTGADTKRMLNEFSLSELVIAGYTALQLKNASESLTAPVVINDKKVTIAALKALNVSLSQMLDAYLLSELISNDYRVYDLYNAKTTLTLSDFVTASAPLWDLMNNYDLNLLVPYFTVAQLITSSNEKDSGVFRVTATAKQELNLKAGTLKTAGFNIKEMMNSFSLSDLIIADYTVSELKTASESTVSPVVTANNKVTIQKFKLASANVSQMLESYSLSELISNDYRVSVLYNAKTTLTLSDFVTAGAPLWDLLNHYSLYNLLAYPFTVSQLISASNEKDELNNYKVTVINYQELDLKAEAFREAGNAPISQLLDFFSLSGFISGGYSVSFLLANKPTLTLVNFVNASAPLWDLINNYAFNLLIPYFTVAEFITASNLKDSGVYKVTDTSKQDLNLKAGTMKTAGANIKEMMNSFSLSDLIIVGYHVDELIIASNDTNAPIVTASNKVTVTKFKDANAPKTQMMNAYSLSDLFYYGYSVVDIINTSNEKENGNFLVINTINQSLDTKPKTLKDALAPTVQMLNYFTLSTLLNTPVSYTVAELKQASDSSDVLEANKVSVLKFRNTFSAIGVALNTSLISMFGSYSLAELLTVYTVTELAAYDSTITIMNFYNSSANTPQMISYFPLTNLVSADIYSVSTFISNNLTPQQLVDAGMPLWKMLNEFNGGIGYLRQANSATELLSISQLLDAVSNSSTDNNKKGLIAISFYLGVGAPFLKPNNVDTPTTEQINLRNYDIFNNSTLTQLLKVSDYSVDYIITTGNSNNVTYLVHKNLNVQSFIDASKLDSLVYQNRLSNFIEYFLLSDLVNNWSVSDLKIKGASGLVSDEKVVTLDRLKVANAPIWDMLNNFTLAQLVTAGYTTTQLVSASSEKNNDDSYKVTLVANRDISLTTIITAGAPLYDLMNYYTLTQLIAVPYSVSELIIESNLQENNVYKVTKTEYQQLDLKAGTFKTANALIGQMILSFTLSDLIAVDYRVTVLKASNSSFTIQDFKDASTSIWDMLNNYTLSELYTYYTISELRDSSLNIGVTVVANQNLTISKFKSNNAPIWQMLNAYQLSELTPFYTAGELVDNSKTYMFNVNEPNANLNLDDLYRVEDLWDIMNTPNSPGEPIPRYGINELLDKGYTVKELRDTIALKDENDNYRVTLPYYRNDFNVREIWKVTQYRNRSIYLSYLAQTINAFDLSYIIRVNFDYMEWGVNLKLYDIYPFADILDAQTQYGSTIIDSDKQVTALKLANAIKSYEVEVHPYFINKMSDAYGGANNITTLQVMLQDAQFKPIEILSNGNATYYNNMVDVNGKPTKVINFRATAVGTNITSSDMYEAFTVYELLSAYTITEINNIRVNLATPLPILTVYEILNLMGDISNINYPQPYYEKIRDDLVNLVKNGTFSYSLSDVYANNYTNGSARYIGVDNFKNTFTIGQLKDAGANFRNMVDVYYLTEAINNFYQNPPVETSLAGLTELLTVYSVSEIGPIDTPFDWNGSDRYALLGFPIRLFKSAGADIKQMLNYFNTLNIYGQYSDINLQNNTNGLYWLLFFGYTISELKVASESTTGTIVANDKKVTIAQFKQADADIKQMLTVYNTNSAGLNALLNSYTVLELKTASDSIVEPIVPADKKISIEKFYDAQANVVQMLNVYNTGSVGLKALLVEYTVSELHSASNSPSIANFKAADADFAQMLTAFNTGSVGLKSLLDAGYTVSELHSASNSPSIANFKAADASKSQMLTAYNINTDGLIALLVEYTVSDLVLASDNVSVATNNKVTIAKFKLANADVTGMLSNYLLSNLVSAGYTSSVLVTASSQKNPDNTYKVTQVINRDITLANMISAGAPLYDLMNFYTLSQLISAPVSYSVASLITASNLKDANNNYMVTVTDYQQLDTKVLTFKSLNANASQMVGSFTLSVLIGADYRVLTIKNASLYTITDFKNVSAPLWDMLNVYNIDLLINAGYTVAELRLASQDVRSIRYINLNAPNFISYTMVNNYNNLAVDILNNFTLAQVTNITWRVPDLVTYSNLKDSNNNFMVTVESNNRSLVLNDFKTRSNALTWDILQYYGLAAMVTGGYTVAELKQTIVYNAGIDLNKRVTIASLKTAEANIRDVINNYTLREIVDNSLTNGGYTLTQLINASSSTDVPVVTSDNKVTLARLLALTPALSLEYLLTHYTTFELIKGGVPPVDLANIRPTIINDIEAIGYQLKIVTPQLLSVTSSNGVVSLNINQRSGSDVAIQKYFVSYTNDGKTFTPFTVIMNTTQTPNVPQLGNTLYLSGLTVNKYYSFRIMASSGTVYSSVSNTIRNFFLG